MKATESELKKLKLVIDNDYILWLKTFSEKHTVFFDDIWPTYPFGSLESDKQNIRNLQNFYSLIDEYAKNNSFNNIVSGCSHYYLLKIDNNFYEIGFITYPEILFFCKSTIINKEDISIDFVDIQNNYVQKYRIDNVKNSLIKPILSKKDEDVIPLEDMEQTVNKVLLKVKNKKK